MNKNPYFEYLINPTEENKLAVEYCKKYFDAMLEANYTFSNVYTYAGDYFDYELDSNVFVNYLLSYHHYQAYLSSIIPLDDLGLLVREDNLINIAAPSMAEMELAYDLTLNQYYDYIHTFNNTFCDLDIHIDKTLYIFKYYMYITFFTAAIYSLYYLYYKFKNK